MPLKYIAVLHDCSKLKSIRSPRTFALFSQSTRPALINVNMFITVEANVVYYNS